MSNWTTKACPISGEYWEVRDGDGDIAADMIPDEAIARLVAAAPELLALLKDAVAIMSGWSFTSTPDAGDTETVRSCKAAIAKAEGRE
jgi:hypothetical protein